MLQPADRATDHATHAGPTAGDAAAATGAPAGRVASQAGALVGAGPIQAKDAGGAPGASGAGGGPGAAPGGGGATGLPDGLKSRMEGSFGADFSAVKVHTDSPQAQALGAHAFAQGSDLHFAPGQFQPGSEEGDALIGHELAHVVQQGAGVVSAPQGKGGLNGDAGLEHEADVAGAAAARGQTAHVEGAGAGVQAKPDTAAPVQAKLAGSSSALAAAAGHDEKQKRRFFGTRRTTWEKLLDSIADYEKREKTAVDEAKPALGKVAKAKLLAGLNEIETLGEQYLQDNAEMLRFDVDKVDLSDKSLTKEERAARVKQNNAARTAKRKLEESAEGQQIRMRGSMVKMMLPRVRLERADILSGRWSPTTNFDDRHVDASQVQDDAVGGALNRLDKVGYGSQAGFFKQDKNIEGGDAGGFVGIGQRNEGNGVTYDANNGARSVAMSRLDELLGAGLMAKTEFATHSSTTGNSTSAPNATSKLGTFMAKADGDDAASLARTGRLAVDDTHKAEMGDTGQPVVSLADPTVQRSMNVMQIVDAIAGQLDRHNGNYLFKIRNDGSVEKVTGIDLDMAFGEKHTGVDKDSGGSASHFKGLPVIYDRAFAMKVLGVTEVQLRGVLAPLLTPGEVDAAASRLKHVHDSIRTAIATNKMIDTWDESTARQQTADDTSYVGKARLEAFMGLFAEATRKSSRPNAPFWQRVMGSINAFDNPDLRPTHLQRTIQAMDHARSHDPNWVAWQRLMGRIGPLEAEGVQIHQELVRIRARLGDEAGDDPTYTSLATRAAQVNNTWQGLNNGVSESDWAVAAMAAGIQHFLAAPATTAMPRLPAGPVLPPNTDTLLDDFERTSGLPSTARKDTAPQLTDVRQVQAVPVPSHDPPAPTTSSEAHVEAQPSPPPQLARSGEDSEQQEHEAEEPAPTTEAPTMQAPPRPPRVRAIPGIQRPVLTRTPLPGTTSPRPRRPLPMPPSLMAQGTQTAPVIGRPSEALATASLSGLGVRGGATTQPVPEQVMARNDQQTSSLVGHAPPVVLGRRPLPRKVRLRRDLNTTQLAPGNKPESDESESEV